MRAKQINFSLSDAESRRKCIEYLEKYRDELKNKNDLFVRRLAEIGVTAAEAKLKTGQGDSSREARFSIIFNTSEGMVEGRIIITSTPHIDKEGRVFYPHLAWEFGSGIYFNNGNANPKAHEFGMGVGTFPDQKNALRDYWWYKDDNGTLHLSHGTEATMPMYNASLDIINNIERIAREVFNG